MVSRFPNGSPIKTDGQPHILATFNRPVTKQDLIGKVRAVFYDGTDVFVFESFASAQVEQENILVLKDVNGTNAKVEINIDGANLVENEGIGAYYFDIDFDGQHRKFFEKTSAVYLMQLPNIIATSSTPKYAIAQVTNQIDGLRSKTLTVNLAINDTTDYQPIAADAELTDIDVNDWFFDGYGSTDFARISELVKQILQVEYFLPESVTINVGNATSAEWTVDGGLWNLFTDGSVYVPLMLTSRLADGSPVFVNTDSDDPAIRAAKKICTFNRPTTYAELLLHDFKAVTSDILGRGAQTWPFIKYDANQYCFGDDEEGGAWVELRNNGSELWAILTSVIWDVDLDNQFKRPLRIVDESGSEDYTFRTILTPDYINDSPYQFVLAFATDRGGDYVYIPKNANDEIRVFDPRTNSYVYRQSEIQLGALVSLVTLMYRLEFEMTNDGIFGAQGGMPEDLPNGSFDIFTDSEVIVS